MTDSLQSINYTPEDRSSLYYGKYKYRVAFNVVGGSLTNYVNSIKKFEDRVKNDKKYYLDHMKKVQLGPYDQSRFDRLNEIDMAEIRSLLDFKNRFKRKVNNRVQMIIGVSYKKDRLSVYTNDEKIVKDAISLQFSDTVTSVANICIPQGVMTFVRPPKYEYRAYMRSKFVDQDFKDKILNLVEQYPEFTLSKSFLQWTKDNRSLTWKRMWLQPNFFIEYNNEANQVILMLYFDSSYISKYFRLEQKAK
jgi:hypothetical protein